MLNMLLQPSGVRLTIVTAGGSSLKITDKLAELEPSTILISHLPPVGLARARYLTKRMRARYPDVALTFAYWDHDADTPQVVERLKPASAGRVVVSLAAARAVILDKDVVLPPDPKDAKSKAPSLAETAPA
jgi:hypothetical protein